MSGLAGCYGWLLRLLDHRQHLGRGDQWLKAKAWLVVRYRERLGWIVSDGCDNGRSEVEHRLCNTSLQYRIYLKGTRLDIDLCNI